MVCRARPNCGVTMAAIIYFCTAFAPLIYTLALRSVEQTKLQQFYRKYFINTFLQCYFRHFYLFWSNRIFILLYFFVGRGLFIFLSPRSRFESCLLKVLSIISSLVVIIVISLRAAYKVGLLFFWQISSLKCTLSDLCFASVLLKWRPSKLEN